jgi:hypothetical protein
MAARFGETRADPNELSRNNKVGGTAMIYFFLTLVGVIAGHQLWAKLWPRRQYWPQQEGGDTDTKARVFCSGPSVLGRNSHMVGEVDTKTLVVGQKVHMITLECYEGKDGTVVKVTPSGAEVRAMDGGLYRFDNKGYELDADRRDRLGFGPSPGDTFHNVLWFSAPECQPWHLVDIPYSGLSTSCC